MAQALRRRTNSKAVASAAAQLYASRTGLHLSKVKRKGEIAKGIYVIGLGLVDPSSDCLCTTTIT